VATLESLEQAIIAVQSSVLDIKSMLSEQNGRQRHNTETIIRICAMQDQAIGDIREHDAQILRNAEDIRGVRESSTRWDRTLGALQAVIAGILVWLGLTNS